jgi:hypothetical protein
MATFEVEIYGYGGEVVIGKLTKKQYDYWQPISESDDMDRLDSHIFSDPYDEGEGGNLITNENDPRFLGYWHDIDSIAHSCGPEIDGCTVLVTNIDDGEEVYKTEEPEVADTEHYNIDELDKGYYFKGYTAEKGQFFFAEMEADKFDPSKLTVKVSNIDGNHIIDKVEYDGEYLENEGGGTNGKGNDYEFVEIP